jgi:hypothetical protein
MRGRGASRASAGAPPGAGRDAVGGQLAADEVQHEGHGTDGVVDEANGGEARDQAGDARRVCELDERFDRRAVAPGPVPGERGGSPAGIAIRATATITTTDAAGATLSVRSRGSE